VLWLNICCVDGLCVFHPVEVMNPIGFEEIDQEDDGAEGPGNGVGPGNGGQFVDDFDRYRDITDPENTPTAQHGEHGDGGLSGAPHNGSDTMGKCQQAVKQANGTHMPGAKIDGFRGIIEKTNEFRGEKIAQNTNQFRHNATAGNAEADAFFHPLMLMSTKVLSNEGGERLGKAGNGQEGKAFQFGIGAASGHGGFAESIDIGLHHHIGKGNHTVLHAGWQTVAKDFSQTLRIEPDIFELDTIRCIDANKVDAAQQGADALRNGSGHGGRAHAPMQYCHEQQIQYNIDHRRNHQKVQRMAAVTYGMKNAHKNVIHHGENTTGKEPAEIGDGLGQNLGGCAHPSQNGGGQTDTGNGKGDTGYQAKSNGGMDGFFHGGIVPCAVVPGDDHTGTHRNTGEKADHHENQASGGTDGGEGIITNEIANTPRIKGVIELLEYISEENR